MVTNTTPFNNIPDYPDQKELMAQLNEQPNVITIDADSIAAELKSKRSSNIVMLGAATPFFQVPFSSFEEGIRKIFARKGEDVVNVNLEALRAGRAYAEKNK
jgi:indolepyruvate ferredoxin oxidoreductase beta subunit